MLNKLLPTYFCFFFLITPSYLLAGSRCENPVAKVLSTQGRVEVQSFGSTTWQRVDKEAPLCNGDMVRTARWSRATIVRPSGSGFTMPQNGTLTVSAPTEDNKEQPSWYIKLLHGAAFFRSRQPERFNIQTPFINAVHKGTEFLVEVTDDKTEISVFDGQVSGQNASGQILINKGYKGIAQAHQPPQLQTLKISPEDAVQWVLYYPPIIDYTQTSGQSSDSSLNAALAAYRNGDVVQALGLLEAIPSNQQTPQYLILRAALLLTAGRVDETQALINQIQQLEPNNSEAHALQAIIAVAKNRQQEALAIANKAVTANPKSPTAQIAQSYAYQALFNIEAALKATQEATKLAPDNALAWARAAELQLSQGNKDAALSAARKAEALNPKLARTQTILGFANLAQTDIGQAQRAFEQAISLDSTDPLARLGLGLSKIRKGDIEAGKTDLETAVNLDPNNAVTRSYLGKAYYELRNKDFAGKEFEIAKEMDPKDPTPYFYDAILKQTTNRPVEALHDMQKAMELNDNRAVYRSSLLLDKDLAGRSAAQGRIYNELGFQQQGLLEGWKSVNSDHSNYSAHRLLADNYAALPRHDVARVSELLQSQLLQPVNITPIQPNLGESSLFILNGLGPSDLSFNEFNPLFEYDRYAFQSSGFYASNGTWGDNTTLSGLHDNVSFSLGQFHYDTDGFRENNYLKKDLYNAFVQVQITDDLNLQTEYRHEESRNGDLTLNFNLDNFARDLQEERHVDSYRIGGRYEFTPNSSLLASLIYQDVDYYQKNVDQLELFPGFFFPATTEINRNRSGFISELQHYYVQPKCSLVSGFGYLNQKVKQFSLSDGRSITINFDYARTSFYSYLKYHLTKALSTTIGFSFDFFEKDNLKVTPLNPKLGIEWRPNKSTTIRLAGFRSMSTFQTASQTIEPVQVAGFNQFFDEIDGMVSWRYGVGIDQKFNDYLSYGLEYSERKLFLPDSINDVHRSEELARLYLNFTPNEVVSLAVDFFYEQIRQPGRVITSNNSLNGGFFDAVQTHRVPVTLSLFHPSGFSFKVRNTFIRQKGEFQDLATLTRAPDESSFAVVDLNFSYRLPKRYGMLTVGINNIFDKRIKYQNTNFSETLLAPERLLFSRISLAF